jgi:hypothetical protein
VTAAPTAPAAKPIPDGYVVDAKARLVPVALVKAEHLLEDELVRAVHAAAAKLSDALREFRMASTADVLAFMDLLAEKYSTRRGGERGNLTLTTYDGTLRLQLATNDQLELGPELVSAKELIDTCIRRWSEGADVKLVAIVDDAFNVDQKGKLNIDRILGLRRLAIEDTEWAAAMLAIGDAVRVISTKRYLRVYSRGAVDEKFAQVALDIASA